MRRNRLFTGFALLGALAIALALVPNVGRASSHREAPLISLDPTYTRSSARIGPTL